MNPKRLLNLFRTAHGRATGLAALAAVAALLAGLRASESAKPAGAEGTSMAEQAVKVIDGSTLQLNPATLAEMGTVKATVKDFPDVLRIQGSISVVENLVTVVPCRVGQNAPSRVDAVFKVTGDTVHAGDPLALLYSPDYVSAKEEYLQLVGRDGSAKPGQSADLSGFAAEARQKLELMGLNARDIADLPRDTDGHLVVRAVRDGVITSVNTMVGSLQNLGDTLFTTANLDKVWFSGDLYIEDLPKVREGQKIIVTAEGMDEPLTGTISFISPVVDPTVRTVKVRAIIDNPRHLLRADMFVAGAVVLDDKSALVVPRDALLTLNAKTFCFKAVGNNRFREVPVTVGREDDATAGITGGLSAGDEVVATEVSTLDYALDDAGKADD